MNKQDIQLLFTYNQWANARILKSAAAVTAEQFLAPASYPHGGLRSTLVHALFAEWVWRKRWEGESPLTRLQPEDFPTFESLRTRWLEDDALLMKFIHAQTNEYRRRFWISAQFATDASPFSSLVRGIHNLTDEF